MLRLRFISFYMLLCVTSHAQVSNNNINERYELTLNGEGVSSTTAKSTVEWKCINKALTKKCLVYHNDQWFYFVPPADGMYYLNISSQKCRNFQGVQLILIEGNPCDTQTYKIRSCIDNLPQDDVFIAMDSLRASVPYLVNIDGFLGDFCEFTIQLSTVPQGLPRVHNSLDTLALVALQDTRTVTLNWHVNQALAETIARFEIYRIQAGEPKHTFKTVYSTSSNALGNWQEDYMYTDTVSTKGIFIYKIIGVTYHENERLLLDEVNVNFNPQNAEKEFVAKLPVTFSYSGRAEIIVLDATTQEMVDYSAYDYSAPGILSVDLQKFVNAGLRNFMVKVRHYKSREVRVFSCHVNQHNELILENP